MFRYFGFGSNMNITSLRAKGVEPLASRRAVLHGWRLRFNVQHFFRHEGGVGNIEPSDDPNDRVWGVLHDCADEALAPLDATEAYGHGYDRVEVEVEAETEAGSDHLETVSAIVYVGLPGFINNDCRPSQRYLNILAKGAEDEGLEADYVRYIQEHPVHEPEDYPPFEPPAGEFPEFDAASLAKHPLYTALYGAVFDMSQAREQHHYLKGFFGGRDMTLFHLKRLDRSDGSETLEDIRLGRLNESQMHYLNAYLNEYDREYRYVGRFIYRQEEDQV